jgi:hypothetical protein
MYSAQMAALLTAEARTDSSLSVKRQNTGEVGEGVEGCREIPLNSTASTPLLAARPLSESMMVVNMSSACEYCVKDESGYVQ